MARRPRLPRRWDASPQPRWSRLVLALSIVLAVLSLLQGVGRAHSSLQEAVPPLDGEVVELTMVQLRFGEPLLEDERNFIWILDAAENRIDLGAPRLVERNYVLEADVPTELPVGSYFVRYRAVSSDGHDLQEGGYAFEVVPAPGSGGTIILLVIGVVAMGLLVVLLRPRKKGT